MSEQSYKISEAAKLLNLQSHTLRFWETEFSQLVPKRTEKGQRLYSEADLELLRLIQYLVHEQGLSIDGARKVLKEGTDPAMKKEEIASLNPVIRHTLKELRDMSALLRSLGHLL